MSDHFSGPRALAGPAGDMTDIWAFARPQRPEHLVLAMGVHAAAMPGAHFSDAITCRFGLRPLTIAGLSKPFATDSYREIENAVLAFPDFASPNPKPPADVAAPAAPEHVTR